MRTSLCCVFGARRCRAVGEWGEWLPLKGPRDQIHSREFPAEKPLSEGCVFLLPCFLSLPVLMGRAHQDSTGPLQAGMADPIDRGSPKSGQVVTSLLRTLLARMFLMLYDI